MARPRLLLTVAALLLLTAGCFQEEDVVTQDVVSTIPWSDSERAEYVLLDRDDGEEVGRGTLSIRRSDGQFDFALQFDAGEGSDTIAVLVDEGTLKPAFASLEIQRQDDIDFLTAEYDPSEGVVKFTQNEDRTIPQRLEDHYYDNESSLFLWRTIPFEEGFEASYHSVLARRGSQPLVTVNVVGQEEITVPAGTFQTWRVEIRSSGVSQVAWYADTPERALVQYDNSELVFQLTDVTGSGE